jgi:hypothetical protein
MVAEYDISDFIECVEYNTYPVFLGGDRDSGTPIPLVLTLDSNGLRVRKALEKRKVDDRLIQLFILSWHICEAEEQGECATYRLHDPI